MKAEVTPGRIQQAYDELGYEIGWRFMTCPAGNFENPRVLVISLNPSGRIEHGPRWSQEAGSAYEVESWAGQIAGRAALQIQIQRLVKHLGVNFSQVASAHFVPFRSQRWADLANQAAAVQFSRGLWADFVSELQPDFVICLGTTVGSYLPSLLGVQEMIKKPTGWGKISLSVGTTGYGGQLTVLPHLGTFKLFSRENCAPFLNASFGPKSVAHA